MVSHQSGGSFFFAEKPTRVLEYRPGVWAAGFVLLNKKEKTHFHDGRSSIDSVHDLAQTEDPARSEGARPPNVLALFYLPALPFTPMRVRFTLSFSVCACVCFLPSPPTRFPPG